MEKINMGIDDLNIEMVKEKYPQLKMTKDKNSYIISGEFIFPDLYDI